MCKIISSTIKKIKIENQWYDITSFIKRHPGGNVIESYSEQDATLVYREMHRRSKRADKVLDSLPKLSVIDTNTVDNDNDANMIIAFKEWTKSLEERGFFEPSLYHTTYRIIELLGLFVGASLLMGQSHILYKFLSILTYGLFGGRCGWLQHEAGHRSLTGNIPIDNFIQKAVMGSGLMISGSMWNSMHNKHHATTQKLHHDIDLDTMPFVLFHEDALQPRKIWSKLWLRYQAYTFLPITSGALVTLFWMYYLHPRKVFRERDWVQGIFMLIGHFGKTYVIQQQSGYSCWNSYLLNLACMYVSGVYLFGHFSTSHTFMPVIKEDETPNWIEYSLGHTVDISPQNWAVSWIMGYLNCQCVHHLFPQMPQFRQPEVSIELEKFAKKWDLKYYQVGYFEAWYRTFANLDRIGKLVYES
jgi:fatty acid desaturase 2 (delta-6 desaturase)